MFILKKGHQPGVYVPLRALFLLYTAHVETKILLYNIMIFADVCHKIHYHLN